LSEPQDKHKGPLAQDVRGQPTRALVLEPDLRRGGASARDAAARLDEAVGLAQAIDLDVVSSGVVPLSAVRPATFLGKGKVEELAGLVRSEDVGLVVIDTALSPVQQRNLERAWSCKVLDRTGLILEIFGRRARTREGVLQVELAHLTWQRSRLVRSWTHLERQRGGFGVMGGPGETQIETDRRLLAEKIGKLKRELDEVRRTRGLQRSARKRVPFPTLALVGYTNAGKSTLFNRLTRAEVVAADMLFATLDPTLRAVQLPSGTRVILSDTVGFISELPTMLVAAFRATLEEVLEADVVLHVRDISHGDSDAQAADVAAILGELGIDAETDKRLIEVWNKIDLLEPDRRAQLVERARHRAADHRPVPVSALGGEGMDALLEAIEIRLAAGRPALTVVVAPTDGEGLHWLYRHAEVLDRNDAPDGAVVLRVRVAPEREEGIRRRFGLSIGVA